MGLSVEVVRKPPKPVPEKVAEVSGPGSGPRRRARRSTGRGSCRRGAFRSCLAGGWWSAPSRTFAWIGHNRRMARDYERLCATGEAFVYAAMTRLMVRRLARA
jgi:hypothetical protein